MRTFFGRLFYLATQRWFVRYGLFFVIWLIGTLGFKAAIEGGEFGDSAYRALQLFALNYEVPRDVEFTSGPVLELVRFVAAGFAVFALISLLSRQFSSWFRRMRQVAGGRQIVLLGFGEVNRLVLAAHAGSDVDILVVDKVFHEADYAAARAGGYLLYERNLADEDTLDALSLDRACRVYVACGSDAMNLKVGSQAARCIETGQKRLAGPGTIHAGRAVKPGFDKDFNAIVQVHISSPRFMLDLGNAEDHLLHLGKGKGFFSIKMATAGVLTNRARFVQRARDLGQERAHVVIVGGGEMAEAIVCDVLHRCGSDAGLPRLSILDPAGDTVCDRFHARYAQLFDDTLPEEARPDVSFITADVSVMNFDHDPLLKKLEAEEDPPTAWVFVCRDDEVNLEASLRLEAAMDMGRRAHVPVFKRIWQGEAVPLQASEAFGTSEVFGQRDDPHLCRAMTSLDVGRLASKIHHAYGFDRQAVKLADEHAAAGGTDSAPFTYHWVNLPANVRRSNGMAADFLPQKLRELGFNWREADSGVLPHFAQKPAVATQLDELRQTQQEVTIPDALTKVAQAEHRRWMVDRAMAGWVYNPVRSNRLHHHPDMVGYQDLDHATRKLDLTSLAVALDLPDATDDRTRPIAYPVSIARFDIHNIRETAAPEGTTDLILSFHPAKGRLHEADLKATIEVFKSFGALASSCRVLFEVCGFADFEVADLVSGLHDSAPQHQTELHRLVSLLTQAGGALPAGVLVDVVYRPEGPL